MPNNNEGNSPAPGSVEAEAIAALEKEGHEIPGKEPAKDLPPAKEPEKPKDEPKVPVIDPKKDEPKPDRPVTMVPAWKLKVAEDQKAGAEKDVLDLKKQLDELSKQKGPVTDNQKNEIADEIKRIAEKGGMDPEFLTEFADTILKKAGSNKPSEDLAKKLQSLEQERELEKHVNAYNSEFDKDVLPLVKELNLSDQALSQLRENLKEFAFSETYAKLPIKEIFKLKEDTLDLKSPKKSSEGKGIKVRANDVVDLDNLSEEDFSKLTPEQVESFQTRNGSGGWKKPGSAVKK